MKGTLLLKCLAAFCVLEYVGAKGVSGPAAHVPSMSDLFPERPDELEALRARTAELEAVVVLHAAELEIIRQYMGPNFAVYEAEAVHAAELEAMDPCSGARLPCCMRGGVRIKCPDEKNELEAALGSGGGGGAETTSP